MYILIGGAGMMGLDLAKPLLSMGHTIAVIDIDPLACKYAREKIGVMAFEGSAVNTNVLLEAGVRKCGAFIAALREDALNLAMVTLSKHYGVSQIMVRLSDRDFAEPYQLAGATHIIGTAELAIARIVNAIADTYGIALSTVQRQLQKFEDSGLLVSCSIKKTRLYTWNPRSPFVEQVKLLLDQRLKLTPEEEIKAYYRQRRRPRRVDKPLVNPRRLNPS